MVFTGQHDHYAFAHGHGFKRKYIELDPDGIDPLSLKDIEKIVNKFGLKAVLKWVKCGGNVYDEKDPDPQNVDFAVYGSSRKDRTADTMYYIFGRVLGILPYKFSTSTSYTNLNNN